MKLLSIEQIIEDGGTSFLMHKQLTLTDCAILLVIMQKAVSSAHDVSLVVLKTIMELTEDSPKTDFIMEAQKSGLFGADNLEDFLDFLEKSLDNQDS